VDWKLPRGLGCWGYFPCYHFLCLVGAGGYSENCWDLCLQSDSAAPTVLAADPVAVVAVELDCLSNHLQPASFVVESYVSCLPSIPDSMLDISRRQDLITHFRHCDSVHPSNDCHLKSGTCIRKQLELVNGKSYILFLGLSQRLTNWTNFVLSAKIYQIFHTVHHFWNLHK
jgi:hypothetical protein